MTKKKSNSQEASTRRSVSKERLLALTLRSVLEGLSDSKCLENAQDDQILTVIEGATEVLKELGYSDLEGIPRRVAKLNEQLKAAVEAEDGKEIARLGNELERAKVGKPPVMVKAEKVKVKAAEA